MSIVDALAQLAGTPTPSPTPPLNDALVTPGPWGFAIVFGIAVITVLLILDMTRRIRRVRYRSELREKLEKEQRDDGPPPAA